MNYDVVAIATDELALAWTPAEEGLWHRLIRHAWVNGSIPDDPGELASICRVTKRTFLAAWPALKKSFQTDAKDTSRLTNKKLEIERTFQSEKSFTNRANAELRWKRQKTKETKEANAMRTQCERNANLITSNQEEEISSNLRNSNTEERSLLGGLGGRELPPKKYKKIGAEKNRYGEFKNVQLTTDEYTKLKAKLNSHLDHYIDSLDRWGEDQPTTFARRKSHYATLLNWFDRDVRDGRVKIAGNGMRQEDDPDREIRALKRVKEILDA